MENVEKESQISTEQWVNFATNLLLTKKVDSIELRTLLLERGVEEVQANTILKEVFIKVAEAKKAAAQKDILWGAVWCVGGIVFTVAQVGYVFWGAIIFGGIQIIKGISNS